MTRGKGKGGGLGLGAWGQGLALIVLAACTDPAVEMKLVAAKTNAPVDLSCVTAVDILPLAKNDAATLDIGNREYDTQQKLPCATISGAKSIGDIQAQLASQIDIPLPPGGLAGLELRGREGTCDEIPAYRDSVFYGGALINVDQDSIAIPVRYNVMCGQTTTYTVRPIDLPTLVKTKACPTTTEGQVFEGTVRPSLLDGIAPPLIFENGYDIEAVEASGTGKLTAPAASFSESCPSIGYQNKDFTSVVSTCVNASAPTACGQPGEIEIPTVSYDYAGHTFGTAQNVVIGAVWSKATGPVAGATITPDESVQATISYGDVGTSTFTTMPSAASTNASGMFAIYANSVIGITVSAPGKTSQHVWVGAGPYMPGTALVVLP